MMEPVAFARSLDAYLDSLSQEEVRAMVLRSIKRLDGAHRVQLALFLGLDVAGDPIDEVGGSAVDDRELGAFIDSCGLLRERFGAFLRDNPRAIRALGKNVSNKILGPPERNGASLLGHTPLKAIGLIAIAFVFSFVPLGAQYAHQRGMLAGLSEISIAPPFAIAPVHVARAATKPAVHRAARAPAVSSVVASRPHAVRHAAVKHAASKSVAVLRVAVRHSSRPRRSVAARAWKFDPRYNPYVNRSRRHGARAIAFARARAPKRLSQSRSQSQSQPQLVRSGFEGRAQLVVSAYLSAVISGDTHAALQHLGLPADASASNVSESPIVSRDARARVVSVDTQPDGRARVEVEINGRSGEYFETFYVARDGPAVRIVDRFYIPVNRTAEERAARLLAAKDGH